MLDDHGREGRVVVRKGEYVYSGTFNAKVTRVYRALLGDTEYGNHSTLAFEYNGFHSYYCANDGHVIHMPIVRAGRFHPYQNAKHVQRVYSRLLPRIAQAKLVSGADYMIGFELTLPKWASEKVAMEKGNTRVRRAFKHFLVYLSLALHKGRKLKNGGVSFKVPRSQLGGWYGVHCWNSATPLGTHVHVHGNMLNVARNLTTKEFHRFFDTPAGMFKEAWRKALLKVKLWRDGDDSLPVVHLQKFKLPNFAGDRDDEVNSALRRKLCHRIQYCARRPLGDLNANLKESDLHDGKPDWVEYLLRYQTRTQSFGWVSASGVVVVSKRKDEPRLCPICGCELEDLGRTPYVTDDVPWKALNKQGKLVKTEQMKECVPVA